jgi:hypothetical protein
MIRIAQMLTEIVFWGLHLTLRCMIPSLSQHMKPSSINSVSIMKFNIWETFSPGRKIICRPSEPALMTEESVLGQEGSNQAHADNVMISKPPVDIVMTSTDQSPCTTPKPTGSDLDRFSIHRYI